MLIKSSTRLIPNFTCHKLSPKGCSFSTIIQRKGGVSVSEMTGQSTSTMLRSETHNGPRPRITGTVRWWNHHTHEGLVERHDSDIHSDVTCNFRDLVDRKYEDLNPSQEVEFRVEPTEDGYAAKEVKLVGDRVINPEYDFGPGYQLF
eukprot:109107_1